MLGMNASQQMTTSTVSKLTSHIYNYINIPSSVILKCSSCQNEQVERHLQQQLSKDYFKMPDRYVDIYVCAFCKKLDQPKCQYCWELKQCCGHREKVLYKEYFATVKKQLLNNTTNLIKTVSKYDSTNKSSNKQSSQVTKYDSTNKYDNKQSSQSLVIRQQSILSQSSNLFNKLIMALSTTQQQLKQQISQNIQHNNLKLQSIYKQFQQLLFTKIHPYTPQGIQKYKIQKNNKRAVRYMKLQQCENLVKQIESFRRVFQQQAYELSQQYVKRVGQQYAGMLFNKIQQQFRKILTPKITYKSSLCQTVMMAQFTLNKTNNSNSGNKNNNLDQSSLQLLNKLSQRIKQLQIELFKFSEKLAKRQQSIEQMSKKMCELQQKNRKQRRRVEEMVVVMDRLYRDVSENGKQLNKEVFERFNWVEKRQQIMGDIMQNNNIRNQLQQNNTNSKRGENAMTNSTQSISSKQIISKKQCITNTTSKMRKKSDITVKKSLQKQQKSIMNTSWLEEVVNQIQS